MVDYMGGQSHRGLQVSLMSCFFSNPRNLCEMKGFRFEPKTVFFLLSRGINDRYRAGCTVYPT
jgi:hypothetical protein